MSFGSEGKKILSTTFAVIRPMGEIKNICLTTIMKKKIPIFTMYNGQILVLHNIYTIVESFLLLKP